MLPAGAFKNRQLLETLNVAGAGLSLAAATTTLLNYFPANAFSVGIPTLLIGTFWAWLLRQPKKVPIFGYPVSLGWLLSIPLAMLNAAIACGFLMLKESIGGWGFGLGMIIGATFGAIIWVPALLLTILFFGVPITGARKLAEKGLAGRERGEALVGAAAVVVAVGALLNQMMTFANAQAVLLKPSLVDHVFILMLAVAALACSGTALGSALARGRARKAFVQEVEAGRVKHFRIDASPEGKVLMRVVAQGEGYRVADFEQEVALLDEAGEVRRVG
jgi:hypothetical protein